MSLFNKYFDKIIEKGFITTTCMIFQIPFFFFYKFLFKNCNKIFISGKFQIKGKRYIQIVSLSAGSRIRIDAIEKYNNQHFKPKIEIGKNVITNNDIHIACTGRITIGNNVLFASNIYLTDHDHGIYSSLCNLPFTNPSEIPSERLLTSDGYISIGNNVFIGEYVTILKNVKIGEGSIIGAHTLVSKDIPPYTIAIGNPAKIIKKYNFNNKKWETN